MSQDIQKHGREFAAALQANKFERTGDDRGLYFPAAKSFLSGLYIHDVNGQDERSDPNLLPDEALIYLLTVGLKDGDKLNKWYVALFSGNYTPQSSLTAANFASTATEITSSSEGYTEGTRPVWTPGNVSANAVDNVATKCAFTIATSSQLTVNGAALLSEATKGSQTGKIMSAVKFAQSRTLFNTDVFNLAYRVQLTSA